MLFVIQKSALIKFEQKKNIIHALPVHVEKESSEWHCYRSECASVCRKMCESMLLFVNECNGSERVFTKVKQQYEWHSESKVILKYQMSVFAYTGCKGSFQILRSTIK